MLPTTQFIVVPPLEGVALEVLDSDGALLPLVVISPAEEVSHIAALVEENFGTLIAVKYG